MEKYKKMYAEIFNACEKAIDILIDAQNKVEEMYIQDKINVENNSKINEKETT